MPIASGLRATASARPRAHRTDRLQAIVVRARNRPGRSTDEAVSRPAHGGRLAARGAAVAEAPPHPVAAWAGYWPCPRSRPILYGSCGLVPLSIPGTIRERARGTRETRRRE